MNTTAQPASASHPTRPVPSNDGPPLMIITGASRGIGAATALCAARQGWSVAINYRQDEAAAQRIVRQLEALGQRAIAIAGDVGSEADVVRLFETVDRRLGRVTALVNSAGIVDLKARVDEMSVERLERMFRINVVGSFLCAREAIRRMSTRHGGPGGSIVNLSSAASRNGGAGQYVDYAASKGAIDSMTLGLAREVAAEGIRVNTVRPGIIDTDIHASGGEPGRPAKLAHTIPMLRPGTAEEIAESIVFLCSSASSYTTGAILDVTGGR